MDWTASSTAPSSWTRLGASLSDRVFMIGVWFRPADTSASHPVADQDIMTINGKSWPHTEQFTFTQGDTVHWRWINPSASSHPMHLHGFYFDVESRGDGQRDTSYLPDRRPREVTELMLPGGTMRMNWVPERTGNWLFHCHFSFHVSPDASLPDSGFEESPATGGSGHTQHRHRMSGLVLGLHVTPGTGTPAAQPTPQQARDIRLLVQTQAHRFGPAPGYGYVIQTGSVEPARDSIVIPGAPLLLERRPASPNYGGESSGPSHGGSLARHRIAELSRRRARLEWSPGSAHAADCAGRFVCRRIHPAPGRHIHLSRPSERAGADAPRPLRAAHRARAGHGLRSRDRSHRDRECRRPRARHAPADCSTGPRRRSRLRCEWARRTACGSSTFTATTGCSLRWSRAAGSCNGASSPRTERRSRSGLAGPQPARLLTGPGKPLILSSDPTAVGDLVLNVGAPFADRPWKLALPIRVIPDSAQ